MVVEPCLEVSSRFRWRGPAGCDPDEMNRLFVVVYRPDVCFCVGRKVLDDDVDLSVCRRGRGYGDLHMRSAERRTWQSGHAKTVAGA